MIHQDDICKLNIFSFIDKLNLGEIELNRKFGYNYPIKHIKIAHFSGILPEEHTDQEWNDYVYSIRNTIGVDCYCTWVYNDTHKVIGIIAFFDINKKEIKEKHFGVKNWVKLQDKIYKQFINYSQHLSVGNLLQP